MLTSLCISPGNILLVGCSHPGQSKAGCQNAESPVVAPLHAVAGSVTATNGSRPVLPRNRSPKLRK
eukprot:1580269-Alexandrium_andersonii.AAC.1